MSEEWDGKRDIRDTMMWRHVGFILSVIAFFLIFMVGMKLNEVMISHFEFGLGFLGPLCSLVGAIVFYKWFTK